VLTVAHGIRIVTEAAPLNPAPLRSPAGSFSPCPSPPDSFSILPIAVLTLFSRVWWEHDDVDLLLAPRRLALHHGVDGDKRRRGMREMSASTPGRSSTCMRTVVCGHDLVHRSTLRLDMRSGGMRDAAHAASGSACAGACNVHEVCTTALPVSSAPAPAAVVHRLAHRVALYQDCIHHAFHLAIRRFAGNQRRVHAQLDSLPVRLVIRALDAVAELLGVSGMSAWLSSRLPPVHLSSCIGMPKATPP